MMSMRMHKLHKWKNAGGRRIEVVRYVPGNARDRKGRLWLCGDGAAGASGDVALCSPAAPDS